MLEGPFILLDLEEGEHDVDGEDNVVDSLDCLHIVVVLVEDNATT